MTDENLMSSENLDSGTAVETPAEKMLPVSRVNDLVKNAKLDGARKMQDELDSLKRENEELKKMQSMGGMTRSVQPEINQEELERRVYEKLASDRQAEQERMAQQQLQERANELAAQYHSKMEAGKQLYEDFDTVKSNFDPEAFPAVAYLANQADNTAGIIYELAKNPQKLATIAVLAERDPRAAQNQIAMLSRSIKENEEAKRQEASLATQEPLSRMQSSIAGQNNGAAQSIADFKKMFRG